MICLICCFFIEEQMCYVFLDVASGKIKIFFLEFYKLNIFIEINKDLICLKYYWKINNYYIDILYILCIMLFYIYICEHISRLIDSRYL